MVVSRKLRKLVLARLAYILNGGLDPGRRPDQMPHWLKCLLRAHAAARVSDFRGRKSAAQKVVLPLPHDACHLSKRCRDSEISSGLARPWNDTPYLVAHVSMRDPA
jgi:hypothetical protein